MEQQATVARAGTRMRRLSSLTASTATASATAQGGTGGTGGNGGTGSGTVLQVPQGQAAWEEPPLFKPARVTPTTPKLR